MRFCLVLFILSIWDQDASNAARRILGFASVAVHFPKSDWVSVLMDTSPNI